MIYKDIFSREDIDEQRAIERRINKYERISKKCPYIMSEQEFVETIASNLIGFMEERNMSQNQLAKRCGLTQAAINNYINARRMPTGAALCNLAYGLGVTIDELIDFRGFVR